MKLTLICRIHQRIPISIIRWNPHLRLQSMTRVEEPRGELGDDKQNLSSYRKRRLVCNPSTSTCGIRRTRNIIRGKNSWKQIIRSNKTHQRLEPNLSLFELGENGRLYYKGKPLTNRNGKLKVIGVIANTLGIIGLREMGYNITKTHLKPRFVLDVMEKQAKLPSSSEIAKADTIELEAIAKSTEDLISQINNQSQTDELFEHPLHELLGLDFQLRSIRGSLKVEVARKVQLEEFINKENHKLEEFREHYGVYGNDQHKEVDNRIKRPRENLMVRQESIDLLKGRLKDQITSFKEMIAKVLDSNTSLGEKIRTLFREQGITTAAILTAIGMAIGVLVEALMPGGGGGAVASGGGEPPPKDEKGLKEWLWTKLKALASLLGKLGIKAAKALPGIIGGIISWILNRATDVAGWESQNL